jgi:hypothetical protein
MSDTKEPSITQRKADVSDKKTISQVIQQLQYIKNNKSSFDVSNLITWVSNRNNHLTPMQQNHLDLQQWNSVSTEHIHIVRSAHNKLIKAICSKDGANIMAKAIESIISDLLYTDKSVDFRNKCIYHISSTKFIMDIYNGFTINKENSYFEPVTSFGKIYSLTHLIACFWVNAINRLPDEVEIPQHKADIKDYLFGKYSLLLKAL